MESEEERAMAGQEWLAGICKCTSHVARHASQPLPRIPRQQHAQHTYHACHPLHTKYARTCNAGVLCIHPIEQGHRPAQPLCTLLPLLLLKGCSQPGRRRTAAACCCAQNTAAGLATVAAAAGSVIQNVSHGAAAAGRQQAAGRQALCCWRQLRRQEQVSLCCGCQVGWVRDRPPQPHLHGLCCGKSSQSAVQVASRQGGKRLVARSTTISSRIHTAWKLASVALVKSLHNPSSQPLRISCPPAEAIARGWQLTPPSRIAAQTRCCCCCCSGCRPQQRHPQPGPHCRRRCCCYPLLHLLRPLPCLLRLLCLPPRPARRTHWLLHPPLRQPAGKSLGTALPPPAATAARALPLAAQRAAPALPGCCRREWPPGYLLRAAGRLLRAKRTPGRFRLKTLLRVRARSARLRQMSQGCCMVGKVQSRGEVW